MELIYLIKQAYRVHGSMKFLMETFLACAAIPPTRAGMALWGREVVPHEAAGPGDARPLMGPGLALWQQPQPHTAYCSVGRDYGKMDVSSAEALFLACQEAVGRTHGLLFSLL